MADDEMTYKGASREAMEDAVKRAVGILSDKKPEDVGPDSDGDYIVVGESAGIIVTIATDPSALVFRAILLEGIQESAAMLALINEINVDIAIGQIYFYEEQSEIRYYYRYPAENLSPELVASIIDEMCAEADLYDDRLKVRLGGERFIEQSDDEIEV